MQSNCTFPKQCIFLTRTLLWTYGLDFVEPKIGLIFVRMIERLRGGKRGWGKGRGEIGEEEGKNVNAIIINIKFVV